MRVVPYLAIAATALASTTSVIAFSVFEPFTANTNSDVQCANLNNQPLKISGHNYGTYSGCLCTNNLDYFLNNDPTAIAAIQATSRTAVLNSVVNDIENSKNHVSTCSSYRKRSPAEIARSDHRCEFGLTKCGIYSSFSSVSSSNAPHTGGTKTGSKTPSTVHPYECVDTQTNLESCGGCVVSYTLGLTKQEAEVLKQGVDCTTLKGVSDVGCYRGKCVVRKCRTGYELAPAVGGEEEGMLECVLKGKVHGDDGELHQQVGGTLLWKKDE